MLNVLDERELVRSVKGRRGEKQKEAKRKGGERREDCEG